MLQADQLRHAEEYNLSSVSSKQAHMKSVDKDYEELIETLTRLSQDHSQEIMVPFTKKAFIPGKLVHTGEVMVFVGDNWFVTRTVKQSIEIAERRRDQIKSELDDYQKVLDNIQNKLDFTGELEVEPIMEELTKEDIERSERRLTAHTPKSSKSIYNRPAFTPDELEQFKSLEDSNEDMTSELSESDESDRETAVITFTHTPSPTTSLSRDEIHPGNPELLIKRQHEAKTDLEKKPKIKKESYNINTARVTERVTMGTVTAPAPPSKRPVSRFKKSRGVE